MQVTHREWNKEEVDQQEKMRVYCETGKGMWTREEYQDRYTRFVGLYERSNEMGEMLIKDQAVADQVLTLSIGSRVMLSHNVDVKQRLVRNKCGFVTHFDADDDMPHVLFDGQTIATKIVPWEWHVPVKSGKFTGTLFSLLFLALFVSHLLPACRL